MADKIYCGNGKEKTFNDGGSLISLTVDLDTLNREFAEHGFTTEQGKKKVRLNVGQRREADQYGNTHHVSIDTWKPDPNRQQQSTQQQNNGYQNQPGGNASPADFEDDIPFSAIF